MAKAETAARQVGDLTLEGRVAELEQQVARYEEAFAVVQAWGLNLGVEFRCIAQRAGLPVA